MEEKIKKLLEQSKFVQELPDNEKKLVMQNAQDIASDLLETEMEDLDAFVKEKYPDARILQGEVYLDNMKLGKVTDLYAFDAVNNYLQGVENERFLKSSGIENDPNITGSNVLDAEDFDEEAFQNFRNAREELEEGLITYEEYVNRTDDDFLNKIPDDIVIDTPNAPLKGNQLKQILKNRLKKLAIGGLNYLDMYELGLIGYALAEPAAQKLLEPIMPIIIPGYKPPQKNETYKDQVIANLQETAKISPTAKLVENMPEKTEYEKLDNLGYGWLGKMLDR